MKSSGIRSALCVALLLFMSAPVLAADAGSAKPGPVRRDVPTAVKSDRMQYDAKGQVVVFEGTVYVQRPDFEMWAERITLHLKKKAAKPDKPENAGDGAMGGMDAGEIDRIVAERNVRMKRDNRTGECSKATYTVDNGVMVMEGNPILREGDNTIRGEVITFYTRENRSEVRGSSSSRVQAVFTSSGDVNPLGEAKGEGKADAQPNGKSKGKGDAARETAQ